MRPNSHLIMVLALVLCTTLSAQAVEDPPLITVTGTANVDVVPDLVDVHLQVEARDKNLAIARSRNRTNVQAVQAVIGKFAVDPKDVQTRVVRIEPHYAEVRHGGELEHYSVSTGMTVTLRDVKQTADFVAELLNAGANHIHNVQFRSSEPRKHADRARVLALQAAREKAQAAARELGVEIGRPHRVSEGTDWNWGRGLSANSFGTAEDMSRAGTGGIEPGQIKVSAVFTVSFAIR